MHVYTAWDKYTMSVQLVFSPWYTSLCASCLVQKVLENKPISKQCDVYSYGIVVWELLTHKIPFEDVTALLQICQRVATNKEVSDHSDLARPLPTSSVFAS